MCWTNGTYYLPFEVEDIPNSVNKRQRISYYQWVPLMLVCQAILFYVPRAFWRAFNSHFGITVHTITDAAIESQCETDSNKSDKLLGFMVRHTGRYLKDLRHKLESMNTSAFRKLLYLARGSYLTMLYIVIKFVYLGNIVGQSFLLNRFLSTDYHLYGIEVLQKMFKGEDWTTSDRFPRITLCDLEIRRVGNIHRHTVQCTLPMNLFNEIFFIFLWFWFVFVGITTFCSIILWVLNSFSVSRQLELIQGNLYAVGKLRSSTFQANKAKLKDFVTTYLRSDGCFIIRMVLKNAGDAIAAELTSGLWDHFTKQKGKMTRDLQLLDNDAEFDVSLPLRGSNKDD